MKVKEILQSIGTFGRANRTFNKIVKVEVDDKRADELAPRRKKAGK